MPVRRNRYPDSPVFYRRLKRSYPKIVRGEGIWLYDDAGKSYLDACSGAYVANLGHGVAKIAEAVAAQAKRVAYVNGTAFTHEPAERLAAEIASLCPKGGHWKSFFLSDGSDAVEAALKLARQHFAESGRPEKRKIISLDPSYHGATALALSAGGRAPYKAFFPDWILDVVKIPAPYPYRRPEGDLGLTGEALEEAILREGPDMVAAFIAEPVGGSSTGASVPPAGYWKKIREICDRHEVLWIADEVLTGVGRTGFWSALEPYGAVPDVLLFGKGITGGYFPLSVLAVKGALISPIAKGSGALSHNATFSHNAVGCAAALATLEYLKTHELFERSRTMGAILHARLAALRRFEVVGDVRGRGLLAGVEFVRSAESKEPFARSLRFAETFAEKAQEAGLVVWPASGQADGTNGDLAMIAPPFVIDEAGIDEIVKRFETALDVVLAGLKKTAGGTL